MRVLLGSFVLLAGIWASTVGVLRCEFRKYLFPEQTHYIYSPGYPRNYSSEIQCRWIITSPPGFLCRLNCSQIVLEQSPECSADHLLISELGDPLLATANSYCRRSSIIEVSIGRRITIGLLTRNNTPGGRFLCEVTAEKGSTFYPLNMASLKIKPWIETTVFLAFPHSTVNHETI